MLFAAVMGLLCALVMGGVWLWRGHAQCRCGCRAVVAVCVL